MPLRTGYQVGKKRMSHGYKSQRVHVVCLYVAVHRNVEKGTSTNDTGVVDENVNRPRFVVNPVPQCRDSIEVCNVGSIGADQPACGRDSVTCDVQGFVVNVDQENLDTLGGQAQGQGQTDALRSTGNQCPFTLKILHVASPVLTF